jgi:competence protein ComEA
MQSSREFAAYTLLLGLLLNFIVPASAADLVDINSASATELAERLPGIGPAKADSIIQWRQDNGPFPDIDALIGVRGIGPKTLEQLRSLIRTGDAASARQNALASQQRERQVKLAVRRVLNIAKRDLQNPQLPNLVQ